MSGAIRRHPPSLRRRLYLSNARRRGVAITCSRLRQYWLIVAALTCQGAAHQNVSFWKDLLRRHTAIPAVTKTKGCPPAVLFLSPSAVGGVLLFSTLVIVVMSGACGRHWSTGGCVPTLTYYLLISQTGLHLLLQTCSACWQHAPRGGLCDDRDDGGHRWALTFAPPDRDASVAGTSSLYRRSEPAISQPSTSPTHWSRDYQPPDKQAYGWTRAYPQAATSAAVGTSA